MKARLVFFSIFYFTTTICSIAQNVCGTDHMYEQQLRKDPSVADKRKALSDQTREFVARQGNNSSLAAPYIIPTVVHIIHNWGAENITDAQVKDAIRIANEDLQKLNSDTALVNAPFIPVIGKVNVELRLAQLDPSGNCTNGITRTVSLLTFNADDNVKTQLISWDNNKYLNIWVVAHISFGAGGYSYYPGTAPPGCEGIVVLHTQFGGIGTSCGNNFCKRTLTHELGHYFNLAHTWGSSNSCGDPGNCGTDDGVTDTPNTIGNCQTCDLNANSCGFLENVENYMDYATCTKMFTMGQAVVANAAINSTIGGRQFLWQPANLTATGTDGNSLPPCIPITYFTENTRMVCAGDSIKFTDLSWNAIITSWSWSFPGGTPSVSLSQNPTIVYNTPGTYSASLFAGTSTGTSSYVKTSYITVSPTNAAYNAWQYYEGFDNTPIPNSDWIVNDTNGIAWQQTNTAFFSGSYSAYINNFLSTYGDGDQLISPSVDLTQVNNPRLYFRVAFAQIDTSRDLLRVYVSTDCGKNWQLRYARYGSSLSTAPPQSTPYVPSNFSQWRMDSVSLASYSTVTDLRVKFDFLSRAGNNIYLDNINISGPLDVNEINGTLSSFSIFPNPSSGQPALSFSLSQKETIEFTVSDILGREVLVVSPKDLNAGDHKIELNMRGFDKGIYFVTAVYGSSRVTEKLLIQ